MIDINKRQPGESFEAYKDRRRKINAFLDQRSKEGVRVVHRSKEGVLMQKDGHRQNVVMRKGGQTYKKKAK